jgi:dTDP-4-dehydrorhamnose reductase
MDIWGGLECSVARVRDSYRDQFAETGHFERPEDLGLVRDLGVRTLRYPVLWEHVAPDSPTQRNWSWHDQKFAELKSLRIEPVVGLVHHGSGPRYTSLLDPQFPQLLAGYAGDVARRYPWVRAFTPVNEPLTTARFSCLYGHWFPHKSDMRSFLRALFFQCEATVLAMKAIRDVTPNAQLVQTEDIGKTFSTPELRYQAAHDNARRWLSLDLLCGRVGRRHPWYRALLQAGIPARRVDSLHREPCPPDIIGINYYLTSDRFLDHELSTYPEPTWGGNSRQRYADVEAIRVCRKGLRFGPGARLAEAWRRYKRPLALTEVHNGSSRDEQIRWVLDVIAEASARSQQGVDIRAVAVWSLFGSVDWSSLLTRKTGDYESGVFDVRSGQPRATALAAVTKALAAGAAYDHPVLDGPGWWRRPDRYFNSNAQPIPRIGISVRNILITGATGTLGHAFSRICSQRGIHYVITSRGDLDVGDQTSVAAAIDRYRPWAIINTAGYVRVPDAEHDRDACYRANSKGASNLADICAHHGIPFVTFSSDLVFDGQMGRAYIETDPTSPTSVYGASKAAAEQYIRQRYPDALIVRSSAFFGPWDQANFVFRTLRELAHRRVVTASSKTRVSATYVPDLCHRVLDLLIDGQSGLWHVVNKSAVTWLELGRYAAKRYGFDPLLITDDESAEGKSTELASVQGPLLPSLDLALDRYFSELPRPSGS